MSRKTTCPCVLLFVLRPHSQRARTETSRLETEKTTLERSVKDLEARLRDMQRGPRALQRGCTWEVAPRLLLKSLIKTLFW